MASLRTGQCQDSSTSLKQPSSDGTSTQISTWAKSPGRKAVCITGRAGDGLYLSKQTQADVVEDVGTRRQALWRALWAGQACLLGAFPWRRLLVCILVTMALGEELAVPVASVNVKIEDCEDNSLVVNDAIFVLFSVLPDLTERCDTDCFL